MSKANKLLDVIEEGPHADDGWDLPKAGHSVEVNGKPYKVKHYQGGEVHLKDAEGKIHKVDVKHKSWQKAVHDWQHAE
jgi:hypothetical protein